MHVRHAYFPMTCYVDQGQIQTGLTGLYKPVRFSKERKSITFHVYN